jgi:general secretion pathway protein J
VQIKKTCKAFTLLEMLVVLMIISLISIVLLQGFTFILHLRDKFLTQLDILQKGALQEYWFRSTTTSLIADYKNGLHLFKGDKTKFEGLTTASLTNDAGVPVPFSWQLVEKAQTISLQYHYYPDYPKADTEMAYWDIMQWQGDMGTFQYMDKTGDWHSVWPPDFLDLDPFELKPQLPNAIMFIGQRHGQTISWIVKINARYDSPFDIRASDL